MWFELTKLPRSRDLSIHFVYLYIQEYEMQNFQFWNISQSIETERIYIFTQLESIFYRKNIHDYYILYNSTFNSDGCVVECHSQVSIKYIVKQSSCVLLCTHKMEFIWIKWMCILYSFRWTHWVFFTDHVWWSCHLCLIFMMDKCDKPD